MNLEGISQAEEELNPESKESIEAATVEAHTDILTAIMGMMASPDEGDTWIEKNTPKYAEVFDEMLATHHNLAQLWKDYPEETIDNFIREMYGSESQERKAA